MVDMSRIIILMLFLSMFIVPVSADYSSYGTVDYSYGISLPYYINQTTTISWDIEHAQFYHRFTDAQLISSVIFKKSFVSTLDYTKVAVTSFTATVDGQYYGSGMISLEEQLDNDVWLIVDFNSVNESYASTLTGSDRVYLSYNESIWTGVILKSGQLYAQSAAPFGMSSSKPTAMISTYTGYLNIVTYVATAENNILSSYSMCYSNSYDYDFNSTANVSSLSISRDTDASLWSVYDSDDFVYFEDQGTYTTTAIDQDFFRRAGVYSNTTFDTGSGPVSIYTVIDFNGTAVDPDAPPDDGDFIYNITTELDEYSPGDTVNVTYTTDQKGTIQVVKTISGDIYHSISFVSGATNASWQFYIAENEPYGFYDVYLLDSSNTILDSVRYSLLPTTSSLDILQSSVDLHETFVVFAQTINESILSIEDPDGVEVWNESIGALMYDYIYYTPTIKTGIYTAYLYDDSTLNDTVMVYLADPPIIDDPLDPETNGSIVVEDVLGDDETMTEYYNEKFRDFAPTIWGFFMLMCLLFLMSILTSFNSGGKR